MKACTQAPPSGGDAAPKAGGRRIRLPRDWATLLCALVAANALFFIWRYRFLPLQDYPDWVYQGFLLSQAMKGALSEGYRVLPYPVPNATATLLIGLFGLALSPETAGKLALTLYALTFIAGSAYLFASTGRGRPGPVLCIPLALLFSGFFFHGYLSYLLALGPLFFGIGYLIRRREDPLSAQTGVLLGVSLVLYLSHALVYAAWLAFLVLFFAARPSRQLAARLLLALGPSLMLLAVYALQVAQGGGDGRIFYGERWLSGKLATLFPTFHLFHAFYPLSSAGDPGVAAFGWLNLGFAVIMGLVCLGAVAAWRDGVCRLPLAAGGVFLLVFLLSPRYVAGNVLPDLRFLFPALWMLLAFAAPALDRRMGPAARRVGWAVGGGVLLLQALFLHGHAGPAARRCEAVYGEMREAVGKRSFRAVFESHFNYEGRFRRVYRLPRFIAVHSPLSRLPYYLNVEQRSNAPIFATGMLEEAAPLAPLDSISALLVLPEDPERLVILGGDPGNRFIAGLLEERYRVVLDRPYVMVLGHE